MHDLRFHYTRISSSTTYRTKINDEKKENHI